MTDGTDEEPAGTDTEPDGTDGRDTEPDGRKPEPIGAHHPGLSAPPTHVLARYAVAGVAAVLAVVGVVAVLHGELPAELLRLVADYFDRLFDLLG